MRRYRLQFLFCAADLRFFDPERRDYLFVRVSPSLSILMPVIARAMITVVMVSVGTFDRRDIGLRDHLAFALFCGP